jgi:hypothetical protein
VVELRDDDLWESALSRERAMIEELQALARKSKFK